MTDHLSPAVRRFAALAAGLAIGASAVLTMPAAASARLAAPTGLDAYAAVNFEENVDPADLGYDIFLQWGLVNGATAYEVRSPGEDWAFRCRSVFETVTPGDPRAPVVRGVGLDIAFTPGGFATWRLPLGPAEAAGGTIATIFPAARSTTVEVRALPAFDSPASEASDPATVTLSWRDQTTRSTIVVTPTPWGVRVARSSTATGPGGTRHLEGRLEAALDGVTYLPVEQYSKGPGGETWTALNFPLPGMTQLVLGPDPAVWPRFGYVLEDGFTYGRVRAGSAGFDPRSRSVRYRQVHRAEIQELPYDSNDFYRFGASSAVKSYTPKPAPGLKQVAVTGVQPKGLRTWSSTIGRTAATRSSVRWTLYRKVTGGGAVIPATAWSKVASGTASYGRSTGSTTPYRLSVRLSKAGTYRLDVTYAGSTAARPDGYSRTFTVR